MPTALATRPLRTFEDILDDLERLSREHLLVYRVEVGGVFLRDIFDGDPQAYFDRNPLKEARFTQFVTEHAKELARYGLRDTSARQCIVGHIVFESLPPAVRGALFYSHVLELSRISDPTQRARLAQAAIAGDWSVLQLRDAVAAVRAGLPLDGDPAAPGVQPPPPPPASKAQPGRLVTEAEKWTGELDAWAAKWGGVDKGKLRGAQRKRVVAAVLAARAKLEALAGALGV